MIGSNIWIYNNSVEGVILTPKELFKKGSKCPGFLELFQQLHHFELYLQSYFNSAVFNSTSIVIPKYKINTKCL